MAHARLLGEEHERTLRQANKYAACLLGAKHFEEAKLLLHRTLPVARRVLGKSAHFTLLMRTNYAKALYDDPTATLGDLREALTSLVETERTTRRVLGGTHPLMGAIGEYLQNARAALRTRETPSPS